jgi:hypothetical protein
MALPAPINNIIARLKDATPGAPQSHVTDFMRLFEIARRSRIPYDREAWLNLAFFNNYQYVEWVPQSLTLREIPRLAGSERMPRPVANKIMHFVEQEHSMVLQTRPSIDVLPATPDPSDISYANVALAYLNWASDETVVNMDQVVAHATKWALAANEGYVKWFWDDKRKRVGAQACSPFDVFVDPYAKSFDDARYVIHRQFLDVEQVYDRYGVEVQPSAVDTGDASRLSIMKEMGFAPVMEGCYVHELWMKPNRRYPDGLFAVWTNREMLVQAEPFPYDHKEIPFSQIGSILRPGTPHYTCAVTYLRSPQMELNKFHAQMIMVRTNYANPKWWIPSDLQLEADPDDAPNQILRGDSNGGTLEPKIIQPATMPPNDQGAWITSEMEDVVGLHEVSQAQVPGRVEAAKAIELLKEADDGRLAELLRTIGSALSRGGYQWLMLARQYLTDEELVVTYSREGLPEVKHMYADKLDPRMQVRVMMGTGLSRSRAAREDQVMMMWDNGIIQDREIVSELLDIPVSNVSPDNSYDIMLATNENYTMGDSKPVVPNSWDNHDIHRRVHNNYRKTQEFIQLNVKEKQMFEFHVQMHDQLQIQSLGAELQRQSLAAAVASGQGFQTPPQPGAPTEPQAQPQPGASPGSAPSGSPVGSQGQGMPGTSQPAPNALGAQTPPDPYAVRDSPQGQVHYQNEYADELTGKPVQLGGGK